MPHVRRAFYVPTNPQRTAGCGAHTGSSLRLVEFSGWQTNAKLPAVNAREECGSASRPLFGTIMGSSYVGDVRPANRQGTHTRVIYRCRPGGF